MDCRIRVIKKIPNENKNGDKIYKSDIPMKRNNHHYLITIINLLSPQLP